MNAALRTNCVFDVFQPGTEIRHRFPDSLTNGGVIDQSTTEIVLRFLQLGQRILQFREIRAGNRWPIAITLVLRGSILANTHEFVAQALYQANDFNRTRTSVRNC